jgi:hypothetical protein
MVIAPHCFVGRGYDATGELTVGWLAELTQVAFSVLAFTPVAASLR